MIGTQVTTNENSKKTASKAFFHAGSGFKHNWTIRSFASIDNCYLNNSRRPFIPDLSQVTKTPKKKCINMAPIEDKVFISID